MKMKLFSYNVMDTYIHRLSGITKLLCFLLLTFAIMFSYDIRVIIAVMIFSIIILRVAKIKFSQIKLMVLYTLIFVIVNAFITFLFAPERGIEIYGTRHQILTIFGSYNLTLEQLLYQGTKLLKYASVIPFGILFFLTTNPSEFAAALSGIGVNYKAAFAVSLTLRYFPDIQRLYHDISLSQQARGLDMSKKASLASRFKNSLLILIPLVFSSLDRIDLISNAMDLRGFGKSKKRTWYSKGKLTHEDFIAIGVSAAIFIGTILVSVFINKSRFFNPFI